MQIIGFFYCSTHGHSVFGFGDEGAGGTFVAVAGVDGVDVIAEKGVALAVLKVPMTDATVAVVEQMVFIVTEADVVKQRELLA